MARQLTIKDIAKKFKCSPSTVSRALNNNPLISLETRATIQEYAAKMGYEKNATSLSLLNKSSKTIGIIVPDIMHSHESLIIEGIQSIMSPLGYMIIVCISNEQLQSEKDHINKLLANNVDAIFLSISQETYLTQDFSHFEKIQNRQIPFAFIDRSPPYENTLSFTVDDYAGAYLATQHLLEQGCQRIVHLAGPKGVRVSELRLHGYMACLKDHDIPVENSLIIRAGFNIEGGLSIAKSLDRNQQLPDGIFGVNDYVCYSAIQELRERNIQIPRDMKVIGFDNSPTSKYFSPSLSSIDRKSFEIGSTSASEVLKMLEDDSLIQLQSQLFRPELVVRKSTQL